MATGYYLLDNAQHRDYPQCGYPRRDGAKASGTIILHDAEGGTDLSGVDMGAENVANYIRTRGSYGSYHDLVDRDTHIPMAPIDYETWHSVPDNPWSFGICVAWTKTDLPKMSYAQRRSYYVPLARVVLKRVAEFARRGIKVPIDRMLTAAETQARRPGISTHSRTDPSRRSDPFGTGSRYEAEFLAVLAELNGNPTTPPEEPDMDKDQDARLKNIEAAVKTIKTLVDDQVLEGPYVPPGGDRKWATPAQALRLIRLTTEATHGEVRGLRVAVETLAQSQNLDPERVYEILDGNLKEAFGSLRITSDPKENTP